MERTFEYTIPKDLTLDILWHHVKLLNHANQEALGTIHEIEHFGPTQIMMDMTEDGLKIKMVYNDGIGELILPNG